MSGLVIAVKNRAPGRELLERAHAINQALAKEYPDARCELEHQSPFELLVATVLSAQCTDVRVNLVTPALFAEFPDAARMARARPDRLEELIFSTGFYRAKAASLLGLSQRLVEEFDGEVPATLDELVTLPGVGRKTANVILGNVFGVPGIPVDTHMTRITRRLGLTVHDEPVPIERDLNILLPPSEWTAWGHRVIFHGRRRCVARRPVCMGCPIAALCPSAETAGKP